MSSWVPSISSQNLCTHSRSVSAGKHIRQHGEQTMTKMPWNQNGFQHLNHSITVSTCLIFLLIVTYCKQPYVAPASICIIVGIKSSSSQLCRNVHRASECGGCGRFLVVSLHLVCFNPEWNKEGGGRLVWGKGQEEERRSKRAGGGGGVSEDGRAGREAETKGKVGRVPRCNLAYIGELDSNRPVGRYRFLNKHRKTVIQRLAGQMPFPVL